ncbi:tetratricopeptide repeat protein [candidate division KSB1 bacterium]|nr:tetratricopeptide repeat protein [candidate division KSB1 bacterium]
MGRHFLFSIGVLALVFIYGCAPSTYYSRGHTLLEKQDYPGAISQLKLAIAEDYRNIDAVRDLGVAVYHTGKLNLAQGFLRLALSRHPNDPMANYYLGVVYEDRGLIADAIKQYSRYTELSPFSDLRKTIEGRLLVLIRRQMKEQIETLLAQEQALDVSQVAANSVAVLYFANLSQNPEWMPLQKGLTDMVITDLAQVQNLTVVERARLQMLIDEMGLGMSGLVKEETAPRMGKLLGAARVVQGSFTGASAENVRIDASLADIRTGQAVAADKIAGSLEQFYQLEKDLVFNIIDALGVKLSREEREAIQQVPTKNLLAFMAFCRGLDYEDKGQWDLARNEFKAAVNFDPGFSKAQSGLQRVQAFADFSAKPVTPPATAFAAAEREATTLAATDKPPVTPGRPATLDLMSRTAANVTPGFYPGLDSRKPTAETGTASYGAANIDIKIRLPIKY